LLLEGYFQHPRLLEGAAGLDRALQVEVIRWEYAQRWQRGERVRRQHYVARFPHLAEALHDLAPRWNCPHCQRTGLPLPDEVAETASCPSCQATVPIAELFPARRPESPSGSDAARPELPPAAGRYRPLQFHAEGGLGKVYRAEDTELQRQVALKRIKPRLADHPLSRRRFLVEAEITARLEHPGIVPVYGLVTDSTGQPCYAMRFIEGPTLDDALREFHEADKKAGRDPGERHLDFRKLLTHFVAVCNAIAYAHSRGILHRDVKPSNILLGKYGETLVVDWGLAKPFERTETESASGEEALEPAEEMSPEGATQPGQAKGTPAFLSPEQAAGRLDEMGPASDVFGLGATLYALLTGQGPYAGERFGVLEKARRGEFRPPRHVKRTVPRALEAICQKAMALKPADRYATVKELGEEVERWLADEPVVAYREPLRSRARRWGRRHKPAVAGATALLLATLLSGGGALAWHQRQQATIEQAVADDLREAEGLQERERWPEALQVLERAEGRLTGRGPAHLRERIAKQRQSVALVQELEEARLQAATILRDTLDYAGADRAYAAAFARHGLDLAALPPEQTGERLRALPIRARLVTALDNWASVKDRLPGGQGEPLRVLARLADDDPWRQQVRDPALSQDPAGLERLAHEPSAAEQPPASVILLSRALIEQKRPDSAERLLRQAQDRHPDDFWLNFDLANLLSGKNLAGSAEAVGYYQAALACRPGTVAVYNNLGSALFDQQKLPEAVAAFRRAVEINGDFADAHYNLGIVLSVQQKLPEAVEAYEQAIAHNPEFPQAYASLGNTLRDQHKLPEAVAACRQAIRLKPDYAMAYYNLGNALYDQQKVPEAIAAYRAAVAHKPDYATAHYNLGNALHELQQLPEAIEAFRQAIAHNRDYAEAYWNLGLTLQQQGQLAEGLASMKRGHSLGSRRPGWPPENSAVVSRAERLVQVDAKLPKVLSGEVQPADAAERVDLAWLCQQPYKQLYPAAVRFYSAAFAADPKLAADPSIGTRYNAACAAVQAGTGQGKEAAKLDDRERARLRQQALAWLRADLDLWTKKLASGKPENRAAVQQAMQTWQLDPDLSALRDAALESLLPAEAAAWRKFWSEVHALSEKSAAGK
jgi:serine/threonine protein kinase/Tfp pilus assembly protein PilF